MSWKVGGQVNRDTTQTNGIGIIVWAKYLQKCLTMSNCFLAGLVST